MAAPAVLRLRDPNSYSYRGLRNLNGAALRGRNVATPVLTCHVLALTHAGAAIAVVPADAIVGFTPADASITLTDCN